MTPSRVIRAAEAWQFMRALAKRARRRRALGWRPTCMLCQTSAEVPATHVDHNNRPLCATHAEGERYAERFT